MWNYSQDDWDKQVESFVKKGLSFDLEKQIFQDRSIPAVSMGMESAPRQGLLEEPPFFLTIQNYRQLQASSMQEWAGLSDIGFRFEQLQNLSIYMDKNEVREGALFISQPDAFRLKESDRVILTELLETTKYTNLGWSPLSFGLTRGEILKRPFQGWAEIFNNEALHKDNCCWFYLSSAPYQWAGAEPHVELAILLSLSYTVLRELDALGVPFDQCKNKISFGLSLGTDVLIESSKVTALKLLYAKLGEVLGSESQAVDVFTLPSLRYFSSRDPWNNIMRMSLMSFSSLIGGASGFKCIPYDVLNKQKSSEAIRVSTNIPLILQKEGFLDLNKTPLDGSPLFTSVIDSLCASAWEYFQQIEKKGGIFEVIRSGWLQAEIKNGTQNTSEEINNCKKILVGANQYVAMDTQYGDNMSSEDLVQVQDIIDPKFVLRDEQDYMQVEPVIVKALAYDWELLQMKSDDYFKKMGRRPKVLGLRHPGDTNQKKSKWVESILSIGGLDVDWLEPEALGAYEGDFSLAVLLPSNLEDERRLCAFLKTKGVRDVWYQGPDREGTDFDGFLCADSDYHKFISIACRDLAVNS